MRVIRGFPDHNVVACYTEPNEIGDIEDFDAPRNAPAKTPSDHLDLVTFHSDFDVYRVEFDQTVTLVHPAIPGGTWGQFGTPTVITWTIFGGVSATEQVLLNHNLGYTPLVMVAYEDAMVVAGTIVQEESGLRRFIGVWADETSVGLSVCGYSSDQALPSVERTYRVLVFRQNAFDPSLPLFSGDGNGFQMGRGVVDSEATYLRRDDSTSPLDMDLGRTVDIQGGGARVITGGNVQDDPWYTGSFTGFPFIPVNT